MKKRQHITRKTSQNWLYVAIGTLLVTLAVYAGGYSKTTIDTMTTMPQLVKLADVIGIGTATNCTEDGVTVNVSSYWLGDPGSNTLYLSTESYGTSMPALSNGISVVFFATTNLHIYLSDVGWKDTWDFNVGVGMFDWNYPFARTKPLPSIPLSFVLSDRAVFNVNEEEGALTLFASNLVQCMRVEPNVTNYYNLVKVTSLAGQNSRRKVDKVMTLLQSSQYDSLPMIQLMAADTNLPPFILNWARGRLNILNGQ